MKQKVKVTLVAFFIAANQTPALAESIAVNSINKANEIIDAAIEAYGGPDRLSALNSVIQESKISGFQTNQSRKPGPPWDRNLTETLNAIDFEKQEFVNKAKGAAGGFEFDNGTIINGDNSFQLDFRAGTAAPIAQPDFNTTSGPFIRVTAPLLVKQLQDRRQTSHWLGVENVDGRPHDIVTLVMEVGPALSLYFDQETHMLNKSERILPGFGVVGYRFPDQESVDGIPFNRKFVLYLNDDLNLEIENSGTRTNASIANLVEVPSGIEQVAAIQPDPLSMNKLADGVYLIGGTGTYAMFVEMKDYVIAVGATAGIPERITELRKEVPDKPIRYAVLTHHHNDHLLGVPAYAEADATIITIADNEEVVRAAAGEDVAVNLEFVEEKRIFTDGNRTLEIIDVGPTPHVEHLLIAWMPKEGIVFEADHFPQPVNGVIPPGVSNTRALAKALAANGIEFVSIVGAHSPRVGTPEEFQTALNQ